MDPTKTLAVTDWPIPTNRKELQLCLGFVNFYRRFIKNYSMVVSPLIALTSTKTRFNFTPRAEEAFTQLKNHFSSAPILIMPDP